MSIIESIGTAAFFLAFAFVVLGLIFLIIHLFSYVINKFFPIENEKKENLGQDSAVYAETQFVNQAAYSSELTLINTDEEVAAMIMAIVSDESGIPLSELNFKSIKLLTKENN